MAIFTIALMSLAFALLVQAATLHSAAKRLKRSEQAFEFHTFRDRLQDLALVGEIDPQSQRYAILIWLCNITIRNAGTLRLRDIGKVIDTMDHSIFYNLAQTGPQIYWEEMSAAEKELTKELGLHFLKTAVVNDKLLTIWFVTHQAAVRSGRGMVEKAAALLASAIRSLSPSRGRVVGFVQRYYPAMADVQ